MCTVSGLSVTARLKEKILIALLDESVVFSERIGDATEHREFSLSDGCIAPAAACFHIALEHHGAVLMLTRSRLHGSAIALLRPQFESFVRGVWLRRCASPVQLHKFLAGSNPPEISEQLRAIESLEWYESRVLSRFISLSWRTLCDYTHTGVRQIGRRFLDNEVTQNYSTDEQIELLKASNFFAALTAFEMTDSFLDREPLQAIEHAYEVLSEKY